MKSAAMQVIKDCALTETSFEIPICHSDDYGNPYKRMTIIVTIAGNKRFTKTAVYAYNLPLGVHRAHEIAVGIYNNLTIEMAKRYTAESSRQVSSNLK